MDVWRPNLLEGVQEDCETLLLKFEKLKSVRFTDFAVIWREMKFSGIFGNKELFEIEAFVPEILSMVKQYFIKATSFNLKVGALYLLYSLYYKQPLKTYKKILITLSDWSVLKEFMKEVEESNHYDTLLIINKLISDNAFLWSATNFTRGEIGPPQKFQHGLFYTNSLVDDINLDNDLQELKEIEEQYSQIKNIACEETSNTSNTSLISYTTNIAEELLNIMNDVTEYTVSDESDSSEDQEDNKEKLKTEIGKRRQLLKSRSFKGKVSPSKSSAV